MTLIIFYFISHVLNFCHPNYYFSGSIPGRASTRHGLTVKWGSISFKKLAQNMKISKNIYTFNNTIVWKNYKLF